MTKSQIPRMRGNRGIIHFITNIYPNALSKWDKSEKIIPDKTILLTVDHDEMKRRLELTKHLYKDIFHNKQFNKHLYDYYRAQGFHEIDTSKLTPDEVFEKIKNQIFI